MTITPETEVKRVLARIAQMQKEKAPSMVLDRGDAEIILAHIDNLQEIVDRQVGAI
jgi:hypothetical protein